MFETLYKEIHSLTDLKPNSHTNGVFSKLYQCVISGEISCEFCGEKKHTIQNICAEAEYEMEKYYAEKIMTKEIKIDDFPYLHNYEKLVTLERNNIKNFGKTPEKMLYIGGGPLPLTAIFYARKYDTKITLLDNSLEAIMLGKNLIKILGLEKNIHYSYSDAEEYFSSEKYDCISVASLVFTHSNLENILKNIQKMNFDILLLRSAQGARELLYKKLPVEKIKKYFFPLGEIHPKNEIINSILLFKKYDSFI